MNPSATMPCLLDGALVSDARISVSAHGGLVACGEGLFETLAVIDGVPGFLAAHLRRLDAACRELGFGPGPDVATIRGDLVTLMRGASLRTFALRVTVYRDEGRVRRLLAPSPIPDDIGAPVATGVVAPRYNGPRPLAALKTLNYLVPRLAHAEGAARGFGEVLFTLPDGTVLEGTRSSVFIVRKGALTTTPLSLPILPGVTREVILGCARKEGIAVLEQPFSVEDLGVADEAFLSASVRGVRPIKSFEGRALATVSGPLTERVRSSYAREILALT
jgi:4-amino-4-deoxychorismate lyase